MDSLELRELFQVKLRNNNGLHLLSKQYFANNIVTSLLLDLFENAYRLDFDKMLVKSIALLLNKVL